MSSLIKLVHKHNGMSEIIQALKENIMFWIFNQKLKY